MPVGTVKKKQELPVSLINFIYLLLGAVTNCMDSIHWLYPSYFKLHVRWLRSITRITYWSLT
ncbi:hypothetical protein, partial [Yersinia pseudotuberculosis]|uniref:hypothetical protein n=1 Tax=Yersinia pseudotuberculosis TaxID=633 RepID=UPI001E3BCB10